MKTRTLIELITCGADPARLSDLTDWRTEQHPDVPVHLISFRKPFYLPLERAVWATDRLIDPVWFEPVNTDAWLAADWTFCFRPCPDRTLIESLSQELREADYRAHMKGTYPCH